MAKVQRNGQQLHQRNGQQLHPASSVYQPVQCHGLQGNMVDSPHLNRKKRVFGSSRSYAEVARSFPLVQKFESYIKVVVEKSFRVRKEREILELNLESSMFVLKLMAH